MWYPEEVERIEDLSTRIDRWVLWRWRAFRRRMQRRRAAPVSAGFGRPIDHTFEWVPRSGGVEHTPPPAEAEPSLRQTSDMTLSVAHRRWRDECARATDAYGGWADSTATEDGDAWRAYELAQDRAEKAYCLYVELAERAARCDR